MIKELREAEEILKPLVKIAEDYKASKGRKAGTLLSKIKNAHLRCSEAITTLDSVYAELETMSVDPTTLLSTKPVVKPKA